MNRNQRPPKISVITPSFNQGEFLETAVRSVLDQGYPNLEYLIVDGGSGDSSVEIIKRYEEHLAWWVSERDNGQTHAINKGFRRATGDLLAWLNSDDFYLPRAFDFAAQAWMNHPDAGLYIGNGWMVDRRGKPLRPYSNGVGFDVETLLHGQCYILQPSVFINRKVLEAVGLLDESLHYEMDVEYWLRAGREFEVVVMDEPLSAYRWYEEIKTSTGGIERWIESRSIRRRWTDRDLTPGLLVELLLTLKNPAVQKSLGMDLGEPLEVAYREAYRQAQRVLQVKDNIPVGRGITFRPDKSLSFAVKPQSSPSTPPAPGVEPGRPEAPGEFPSPPPASPAAPLKPEVTGVAARETVPAAEKRETPSLKVDIVLQATGSHAWGVGGGWANAADSLGVLHRVFRPTAKWDAEDVTDDDGLYEYLAAPGADAILLLGFDWHSQMLHRSPRWRQRWREAKILKILYVQESIVNSCRLFQHDRMAEAARSAAELADLIVYTDLADREFFARFPAPSFWQPFGVDDTVFHPRKPFDQRIARPFFRGKVTPFFRDETYRPRREMIEHLRAKDLIELVPYREGPVTVEDIAADFSEYQVALNFPSVFSNHPTRVYEALACGCALVTNRTGLEEVDTLFRDGEELLYYSNAAELEEAVRRLLADPDYAARVASAGRLKTLQRFTLVHHLEEMLAKAGETRGAAPPPAAGGVGPERAVNKADAAGDTRLPRPAAEGAAEPATGGPDNTRDAAPPRIAGDSPDGTILIDGVIFQLQHQRPAGISRVWSALLNELAGSELQGRIVLLDRAGTAPPIPGLRRREVAACDMKQPRGEAEKLEALCREEGALLHLSTYFTSPRETFSAVVIHDMIPEITGMGMGPVERAAKELAIEQADAYFAVSRSSAEDFRRFHPAQAGKPMIVIPNGVSDTFRPHTDEEIRALRAKLGLTKPYFLLSGHRGGYKNALLFFQALALLERRGEFEVLCTGGAPELEAEFHPFARQTRVQVAFLEEEDLSAAYSGAVALAYPSLHEGFGLPVLEAMRSGCPVITCCNSSLPEVAGDAAWYVKPDDVAGMRQALLMLLRPEIRARFIERGQKNAARFSWKRTGENYARVINTLLERAAGVRDVPLQTL